MRHLKQSLKWSSLVVVCGVCHASAAQSADVIDTTYTNNLMYHDPDTSVAGVPQDYNGDGDVDWRDAYDFAEDAAFVTQSGNGVVPDLSDLDDVIALMRIFGGEATADPGDSDDIICADLQRAAEVLNFPYSGRYPSRAELDDIDTGPCNPPAITPADLGLPGGPGPLYCLGVQCPTQLIDLTSCDSVGECDDDIVVLLGGGTPPIAEDVDVPDQPNPLLEGEDWTPLLDDHGTGPGGDLLLVGNMCPDEFSEASCGFNTYAADEYQLDPASALGGPWYPGGWKPGDSSGISSPPLVLEDMFPGGWGLGSGDAGFGEPEKSLTGGLNGSYLQHKVITDNTGSGRQWVWKFEYTDTDAPGLVTRVWSPGAIASYTAPTSMAAPSTTAASDGFVTVYDYNTQGRRIETAVGQSSSPTNATASAGS